MTSPLNSACTARSGYCCSQGLQYQHPHGLQNGLQSCQEAPAPAVQESASVAGNIWRLPVALSTLSFGGLVMQHPSAEWQEAEHALQTQL